MADVYCIDYHIKSANEATFLRDTIDNFLKGYFCNSSLIMCIEADNIIQSLTSRYPHLDPSLANHGKRAIFMIISNRENHLLSSSAAKRVGVTISGDFVKFSKEMKGSSNSIHNSRYDSVAIVGLSLKDCCCEFYFMYYMFDSHYRMVLIEKFYLPRDCYDMSAVLTIASCFNQMQYIVNPSALKLNFPVTHAAITRHLPAIIPAFHIPVNTDRTKRLNLDLESPAVKNAERKLSHDA